MNLARGAEFVWAADVKDSRAVATADGIQRHAACWFDWEALELEVNLPGVPQALALYFLDWGTAGERVQTVELIDAATGRVLDRQRVAAFSAGRWLKWWARGALRLRIIPETSNAVLSGVAVGAAADHFASFAAADSTTRGDWSAAYGSRGAVLLFDPPFLPDGTRLRVGTTNTWSWEEFLADPRAPHLPDSLVRRAACWYADESFPLDLDLTESGPRQVALYFLDWGTDNQRHQRIKVTDADTGRLLDERDIAGFGGGRHLRWLVGGRVRFEINAVALNAVLSGIFLDVPAAPASAAFAGEDTGTRGQWPDHYGDDGVMLADDATRLPLGAAAEFRQATPFVWDSSPVDSRALRRESAPGRVAACWYDWQAVTFDLTLPGDAPQPVALHFLDWDTAGFRSGEVEVLDGVSGRLLDRRPLTAYGDGRYLIWEAAGPLRFRVRAATANAVLSGVFFGSPPVAPDPEPEPNPGAGPGREPLSTHGRLAARAENGVLHLTWPADAGAGFVLETATALEGSWQPVVPPAAAGAKPGVLSLPLGGEPARFYRLRAPDAP